MSEDRREAFETLTHARLRAVQGDFGGAARLLRVILDAQPANEEALRMLAEVGRRVAVGYDEPREEALSAATPETAQGLSRRFRDAFAARDRGSSKVNLARWLARLQRNRGPRQLA